MTHRVFCQKLQTEMPGLDAPPLPGDKGQRIFDHISKQAWEMWLAHQTMLINEYKLSLIDPSTKEFLSTECEKFLFGEGSNKPAGFTEVE
jgi:Fe-S cluster biosynthesis and repair protein YggX